MCSVKTENFLRYSLGSVFLFFGVLKLFGEASLQDLVAETLFFLPVEVFMPLLAVWEIAIGVCFLYRPLKQWGLILLLPHMAGTFLPIFVAPELVFTGSGLTIEGHYILKNIVLVAAAFEVQDDGLVDDLASSF